VRDCLRNQFSDLGATLPGRDELGRELLSWRGASVVYKLCASAKLELLTAGDAPATTLSALRQNPECGWSWVVSPDTGALVRRTVVGADVWMNPSLLETDLDALVHAKPAVGPAAHRVLVAPLCPRVSGDVEDEALAVFFLARDALSLDDSRHVLLNGALPIASSLAGRHLHLLRARAREEGPVVRALLHDPKGTRELLHQWRRATDTVAA
jgi:hypothetical protein